MSATGLEQRIAGVGEIHIAELMSVIGSAGGGTVIGEGHTKPLASVHAGDVDVVRRVAQSGELGTSTVKGDTLASSNIHFNTGLDGQVR